VVSRNAGVALGCAREREATRGADAEAGAEANVRSVDIMRVRGRRGAVECRRARRSFAKAIQLVVQVSEVVVCSHER
jgi:hypothetical protein